MSRVTSSFPSLVSRAWISNSSMWIEVKRSSLTSRSETDRVLEVVAAPRHEGDEHVAPERQLALVGARPVGDDVALLDPLALRTMGFWLMQVFWFERRYFVRLKMSSGRSWTGRPSWTGPRRAPRRGRPRRTRPRRGAWPMTAPESRATTCSMPVPTSGASGCSSGTAACMFEPMRARLASSFSRNGISEPPPTRAAWARRPCSAALPATPCGTHRPCAPTPAPGRTSGAVDLGVGLGDDELLLLERGQEDDVVGDRAPLTLRYGVSMKPNSFVRAYVDSDEIRPMFGPSGVSIGQMRP